MIERKTVRQKLISFDTDELRCFFDEVEVKEALQKFTASIERQLNTLAAKNADKCIFYLETSCDDYGKDVIDGIYLSAERPETDEEVQLRINKENIQAEWNLVYEQQEYRRLKQKFEGTSND
jgi:hypothetical protein